MSALATIVGSLSELSESELRQLYLMVGVRLGIPDVPSVPLAQKGTGTKRSGAKTKPGKTSAKSGSSKGNPQRKSQWANHPLYQEYSRLKKLVEAQAKDAKCSFNNVDTAESRAYQLAFTQWMEAKSSFRDRRETATNETQCDEESSEEEEDADDESGPPTATGTAAVSSSGGSRGPPPQEDTLESVVRRRAPRPQEVKLPGKGKSPAN